VYTTDESSVEFRKTSNMTDRQVNISKLEKFKEEILAARAAKEREAMLDAYNYLNGRTHQA